MRPSTIVFIAAIAAMANAQSCWDQLKTCKNRVSDLEIDVGQCEEAQEKCQAEKGKDSEQARCWKCAYKMVKVCVDASTGYPNVWEVCYNNALNKHYNDCMNGESCWVNYSTREAHSRVLRQ